MMQRRWSDLKRPAYQSVSVAEYLARKYDITAEVDTGGQGHFD